MQNKENKSYERNSVSNGNKVHKENSNKKITSKQIVAIAGIALLLLMYLVTLLAAIFDKSASGRLFMSSMLATVFIPFLIWIYTWLFGKLTGRRTFADLTVDNAVSENETTADDKDREATTDAGQSHESTVE